MDSLFQPIFSLETFHPSGGIDQFLLAREKGMAPGTNFHGDLFLVGSGADLIAAGTLDDRIDKLRMNLFFHCNPPAGTDNRSVIFTRSHPFLISFFEKITNQGPTPHGAE
jgi:hypothetical protein